MAKKLTRKELLKGSDEFLTFSEKAVLFVREHMRHFQYIGLGVVVLVLLYLGGNAYLKYVNKKAQETYNQAYSVLVENVNSGAEQDAASKAMALFREVIDDHGLSSVSRLAFPELAYLKFQDKKFDEAIPLYQKFLSDVPENSPYGSLARLAIAACHEEMGNLAVAEQSLKEIVSMRDDFFKDQAMLSLARVYRLSGQEEKSKEVLNELIEKYKNSPFTPLAQAYLAR